MSRRRMGVAKLTDKELARIQAMEAELGALVVALEPQYKMADLSAEQVAQLAALEDSLGVILLAYQKD
jgi:hypothetical protein